MARRVSRNTRMARSAKKRSVPETSSTGAGRTALHANCGMTTVVADAGLPDAGLAVADFAATVLLVVGPLKPKPVQRHSAPSPARGGRLLRPDHHIAGSLAGSEQDQPVEVSSRNVS